MVYYIIGDGGGGTFLSCFWGIYDGDMLLNLVRGQSSTSEAAENFSVGTVYDRGVQRLEIDSGGGFGVVPHALADGGNGDIL